MNEYTDIEEVVVQSALTAAAAFCDAHNIEPITAAADVEVGSSFVIPLVLPRGAETGDKRYITDNAEISVRELPIPLLWQVQTGQGHNGSFLIGRIDTVEIDERGVGNARGVFDVGPYGREAERLVRNGFLRGISADLDMFEAIEDADELSAEGYEDTDMLYIKGARVMGATLLPKQAFQQCNLQLIDEISTGEITDYTEDDIREADVSALIASAIPVNPPENWFVKPELAGPTALTIDDGGRVFGHIATWYQDHISFANNVNPPRSKSNYAYFHTGVVRTDTGKDVTVGQLTLAGGHAPLEFSSENAVKHYDDTASAIADVHAGEDEFGIWVAGALRPGVTPEQIRTLRASAPSGDWRPIGNRLELVAVCQVNVPGFPVVRACVASGTVRALVAAGAGSLYRLKHPGQAEEIDETLLAQRDMAVASIEAVRKERREAKVNDIRSTFAPFLEERARKNEALAQRKAELASQVSDFRVNFEPRFHPRDRSGRFRKVLLRLSDLPGKDESGASEALQRAADAQEVGDTAEAVEAAKEARASLHEAAKNSDDPAIKETIAAVENQIVDAINEEQEVPELSDEDTVLEEAIRELIETLVDEAAEAVDPKRAAEAAIAQVIQYVNDKGFTSPEELLQMISRAVMKQLQPDAVQ